MARIAIVGSGISGLGCAYLLGGDHDIVVFEQARQAGGHSRTVTIQGPTSQTAVDTGFIVYNEANYPLLTRLFKELNVATEPSNMSFGVSYNDGELEFCGNSLGGLFAQRGNLVSPAYWSMLRDILLFFRKAPAVLADPGEPSVAELINRMRLGNPFRDKFLLPMAAAIWSSPPGDILDMPAKTLVRFFANHNLLSAAGHHTWRTVSGGSRQYVANLEARLGTRLRVGDGVVKIEPGANGQHVVLTKTGARESFDEVVLACHADTALQLIASPTDAEQAILGAFAFRDNHAVLHSDERLMPKRKAAWASWVYAAGGPGTARRMSVTYWMNKLQNLPGAPCFVTLNPHIEIPDHKIYDRHTFRHPVFTRTAIAAQDELPSIQGRRGLWFCGAWQRYGFHEDGLWSAVRVAQAKGGRPWL